MPTGSRHEVVALSVKLEVLTQDKLKKFIFGLTKSKEEDIVKWAMDFAMLDRTGPSTAFAEVLKLDVALDLKKIPVEAVEVTATKGLNKSQVNYARTVIAADADKLRAGRIKAERMQRTAAGLINARNG
ncbi:MAG: hypothetical protein K7J46_20060 [Bryobacter sp.]|jgi:hypothetical protein|nr:hypothetical protein [Bryobacter sp. CoA8 C33]